VISIEDNFVEKFLVFIGVQFLIDFDLFFSPTYDIISVVVTFDRTFGFVG
jgi:hypothetical protein